jgi:hypothetical protein
VLPFRRFGVRRSIVVPGRGGRWSLQGRGHEYAAEKDAHNTIIAELGDTRRFANSRDVVRSGGLDITVYQSDQPQIFADCSHMRLNESTVERELALRPAS